VKKYGKPLSDASTLIGSTQIRNLGTIGGNIINASPAADTLPPLMVLDAIGRVVSKDGEREVPLFKLFKAPYETDLKPFEILTHVIFKKLPPDAKTVFVRLARREAMAIARISIAIVFRVNESKGFIQDIRISVGSATPTPQRMSIAEEVLKGRQPDEASLRLAARNLSGGMIQRTGTRLSTSYKVPVIEALFMRAFKNARDGFV
jgi:carbon-monoxide dehydrogenase medium subunit/xanthine dehydrogenase FAD-binding subunit